MADKLTKAFETWLKAHGRWDASNLKNAPTGTQRRLKGIANKAWKAFLKAIPVVLLLLSGCALSFRGTEIQLGIRPPTNAAVCFKATKIGISVSQNPATGMYEFTMGYLQALYMRAPTGSNIQVVPFTSTTTTTQNGLTTEIKETVTTEGTR